MYIKSAITLLLFLVSSISVAPWVVSAIEMPTTNMEESTRENVSVTVTGEKAPIYRSEDTSLVGYLKQNFQFEAESIDNQKVFFRMDDEQYYLDLIEVTIGQEVPEREIYKKTSTLPEYQIIVEKSNIYSIVSNEIMFGELLNGLIIQPIQENETEVIFLIGNKEVKVNKSDIKPWIESEAVLHEEVELNASEENEEVELNASEENEEVELNASEENEEVELNTGEESEEVELNVNEENEELVNENALVGKKSDENTMSDSKVINSTENIRPFVTIGENIQVAQTTPAKEEFTANTKYFKVKYNQTPVYVNNQIVAYLKEGQEYEREGDSGNWHLVKIGIYNGYVWRNATAPSDGSSITNLNKGMTVSTHYFTSIGNAIVYDTSNGQRVPYAEIPIGAKYPIIGSNYNKYANWYEVDVLGRIGYVMKTSGKIDFKPTDHYFRVKFSGTPIFFNKPEGGSIEVVHLHEGQVFNRISDYGNWHKVSVGKEIGYVWEEATEPADGSSIKNNNTNLSISNDTFKTLDDLVVYDTSSGNRVPFATIKQGVRYPIIGSYNKYANWYEVDINGRIGYVTKSDTSREFSAADDYFKVLNDGTPVYVNNASGKSTIVTKLVRGQTYKREKDSGNWHYIKIGNQYGYVWKDSTEPSTSNGITNLNNGMSSTNRTFKATMEVNVIDDSTSTRDVFGIISTDIEYPIIKEYEDRYEIDLMGRIGIVYKNGTVRTFLPKDSFFEVIKDNVYAVTGDGEELVKLTKNEVYPRLADYGNWHLVKYNNDYAYVWKYSTQSVSNPNIDDINSIQIKGNKMLKTLKDVKILDNEGNIIGELESNTTYNFIEIVGTLVKVDVLGRTGYMNNSEVQVGPKYNQS